jgi:hypothetical protein
MRILLLSKLSLLARALDAAFYTKSILGASLDRMGAGETKKPQPCGWGFLANAYSWLNW